MFSNIKKLLLIPAITAMILVTAVTGFAGGLVSDGDNEDSDLAWSAPIYASGVVQPSVNFDDVQETDWFRDDVTYIVAARLMEGYDSKTFAPNDTATEAMMVTVLYRMAGSPVVTSDNSTWYSDAAVWGRMNGIIDNGVYPSFEPEKNITRGSFACMLAAYNENAAGRILTGDADMFPDYEEFPDYAKPAAGWAGTQGIVTGRDNGEFDFYGEATRAELAAMLHRYID
ncbi:MAG: S-layer homology domain-containing protein [Candidatus Ornithomonoglobus sp.]